MSDQVQVREGVWLARDGERIEVRRRQWEYDGVEATEWKWEGMRKGHMNTWRDDGSINIWRQEREGDLVAYVGPLPGTEPLPEPEPEPAPEQQPVEIREGVWRTRDGRQMQVRENTDWGLPSHPWVAEFDGEQYIWMRDGRYHAEASSTADLVAYLRPLPKAETTTETLVEIEQQAAEDLQQWMAATALQRRRLEAELSAMTAERDRLQRELADMTKHSAELLESAQQARDERDLLAQRLMTKPSEEFLRKSVARQQIEINTLEDQLQDMTAHRDQSARELLRVTADRDGLLQTVAQLQQQLGTMTADRDRLQACVRELEIEIDAAGQQPAPADTSEQIERIWDEARERAVSEIIELLIPLQAATGTHAESVLQILPAVIRRWMDGGPDDAE
jgi:chorismate mutase